MIILAAQGLGAAGATPDTLVAWQPEWHTMSNGRLAPAPGWQHQSMGYFQPPRFAQARLIIRSHSPFSIWINQAQIGAAQGEVILALDSLRARWGTEWWMGVHAKTHLNHLRFELQLHADQVPRPRLQTLPTRDLSDFAVFVALLLIAYGIRLWRSSPDLFYDYFNVFRVLSTRERDETQRIRITSSQNILYYFFLGGWLSFLVVILMATDPTATLQPPLAMSHFGGLLVDWSLLTVAIVFLLVVKYAVQHLFSIIYAALDHSADQFFTFVRICFLVAMVVSLWFLAYFFLEIQPHALYHKAVLVLLFFSLLSIAFMQVRFMRSSTFRMFHIFSYLCLTEVIPLVITFRILYY